MEEPEERRLARSARPRDLDELAGRDRQVDPLEDLPLAERLDDSDELYVRLACDMTVGGGGAFSGLTGGACAVTVDPEFGRVDAASCRWSATHPVNPRLAHAGVHGNQD